MAIKISLVQLSLLDIIFYTYLQHIEIIIA
jgi:hypothetical protein